MDYRFRDERYQKKYFYTCNAFDAGLEKFISSLKRHGLWDNTILVIASDPSIPTDENDSQRYIPDIPMAFIATNTGTSIRFEKTAGQVDIFPTIAEIMGVAEDSVGTVTVNGRKVLWRGLGDSMFSDRANGAIDPSFRAHGDINPDLRKRKEKAFEVSDLIIRGYYLNKIHQ